MFALIKRNGLLALGALALLVSASAPDASAQLQLPRPSQKATVSQRIGYTDVMITYSRPGVRGRPIWGALVPYDQVWRTGANEATVFTVSDDVMINGQRLAAGTYSLHTIPTRNEWTIIFNRDAGQWGSFNYNQSLDALRVTARPQTVADSQEWFMISFPEVTPGSAVVELRWERLRVPFTITVNTAERVATNSRNAVNNLWQIPFNAAQYAFDNNGNMEDAMRWINQSIAIRETYNNLGLKARMLARAGNTAEAITTAERALQVARANTQQRVDTSELERLLAEWRARGRQTQ